MDKKYMEMALEIAEKGLGHVNPNPLVGAVVVKDGTVVGKGYHGVYGGPHAEVYALDEAGKHAEGADIYVTLEPCSHYGKTPPCAKKIIESGIKRCFVGSIDPNPLVSGKGIEMLKENDIEVHTGVLKEECDNINKAFFKYIKEKIGQEYLIPLLFMTEDYKEINQEKLPDYPVIIKKEHRLEYYEALDKAHTTGNYTDFVKLVTKLEIEILNKYLDLFISFMLCTCTSS